LYYPDHRTTEPVVYIVGEAVAITPSDPVFGEPVLTPKKYAGITLFSSELYEDSEVDLTSLLAERYARQFAKAEQTEFINGSTSGSEGLRKVSGVTTVGMTAGNTTGSAVSFDNMADLLASVEAIDLLDAQNGKFYMHSGFYNILRKSKAALSSEYYMPVAPTQEDPAKAWGREIVVLNEMPAPSAVSASTKFILFGDLKKHAFIGDRRGITTKVLEEGTVGGVSLAETDQMGLRMTKRTAFVTALQNGLAWLVSSPS